MEEAKEEGAGRRIWRGQMREGRGGEFEGGKGGWKQYKKMKNRTRRISK